MHAHAAQTTTSTLLTELKCIEDCSLRQTVQCVSMPLSAAQAYAFISGISTTSAPKWAPYIAALLVTNRSDSWDMCAVHGWRCKLSMMVGTLCGSIL
jgi:hypothetical protein